jgi:hypothetical protein
MAIWRELCIYRNSHGRISHGDLYPAEFLCRVFFHAEKEGKIVHVRQYPAGSLAEAVEGSIDWGNRVIPDRMVRLHPVIAQDCQIGLNAHRYAYEPLPKAYHPLVNARFRDAESQLAALSANYFKQEALYKINAPEQAQNQARAEDCR